MNIQEFHRAFKIELDKTESLEIPAYLPEEIDYWINRAIENFVKTRYDGLNPKRESVEETQKRKYDLQTLIKSTSLEEVLTTPTEIFDFVEFYSNAGFGVQVFNRPSDLLYIINDDVIIEVEGETKYAEVKPITQDRVAFELKNPYSEYRLHYNEANPLRVLVDNYIELFTDANYTIHDYNLTYIKDPVRFNSLSDTVASGDIEQGMVYSVSGGDITYNGSAVYGGDTFTGVKDETTYSVLSGIPVISMVPTNTDLPQHAHEEVVKIAVKMALENIEQPRYQTYLNEVNTME